jgi:pimeloyl-ACP methyl ester carboxylesterase
LGFDRAGWIPVLPELEREFRIVLIDSRGTGQSTTKEYRFTVGDLAGDVVAVLASGQIPSAHMLGVSLGGMIAQEVAIDHPARVDRLVLACTTPGWPFGYPMPRPSLQRMREAAHLPAEVVQRSTVAGHAQGAPGADRPDNPQPGGQAGRLRGLAGAGAGRIDVHRRGGARQSRIRAMTLVVCGDSDSVVDPQQQSARRPHPECTARGVPRTRPFVLLGRSSSGLATGDVFHDRS